MSAIFLMLLMCSHVRASRTTLHNKIQAAMNRQGATQFSARCPEAQKVCNVVLVIDMQNDYCSSCDEVQENEELKASQSPWSGTTIKAISPAVQDVLGMRADKGGWDMVVLTKDTLKTGTGYLEAGTPGSSVVKEITDYVAPARTVIFSKDTDDWMNTLDANTSFDGQRHFALEDEAKYVKNEFANPSLKQILQHNGFHPGKTNLVVTGVLTNRCVLKGAVHAQMEGYAVFVVKDATGGSEEADRWQADAHDAPDHGKNFLQGVNFSMVPVTRGTFAKTVTKDHWAGIKRAMPLIKDNVDRWRKRIFTGYKGGPALADTWTFLSRSFVYVVETAADFNLNPKLDLDILPLTLYRRGVRAEELWKDDENA